MAIFHDKRLKMSANELKQQVPVKQLIQYSTKPIYNTMTNNADELPPTEKKNNHRHTQIENPNYRAIRPQVQITNTYNSGMAKIKK